MHTIAQIRAMSDDEIIEFHDRAVTPNQMLPQDLWLEELHRRDQQRASDAMEKLAKRSYRLTWANWILALIATAAAVAALAR